MLTESELPNAAPAEGDDPGGRFVVSGAAAPAPADPAVYGDGVALVLDLVAERMPVAEVESAWAFPGVLRDGREHGLVVVARRTADGRHLVYRGRYAIARKGQDRGKTTVSLEETALAPADMVARAVDGVQDRAAEAGLADPLDLAAWKGHGAAAAR